MTAINICGVLLRTMPEYVGSVKQRLEAEAGVEVHHVTDDGRLIVTVEKDDQEQTGHALNLFEHLDHVISASVVYQYFDDEMDVSERGIPT